MNDKPTDSAEETDGMLPARTCSRSSDTPETDLMLYHASEDDDGDRAILLCRKLERERDFGLRQRHSMQMEWNDEHDRLIAALVARIKKWADWKQNPDDHLNGCDPKWYEGWITGKIEELQNVREMLECLKKAESIEWAIPSENERGHPTAPRMPE